MRKWLSLDAQQMPQVSWNLIGSHVYIPEPITMAQAMQYTHWPSFDDCSPSHVVLEKSPTLAWIEWQRRASQNDEWRKKGDGCWEGKHQMCTPLWLPVPPLPLCLLSHGRKSPVLMSCWVQGMLIPLTGELCTQKGHLHSAQYD